MNIKYICMCVYLLQSDLFPLNHVLSHCVWKCSTNSYVINEAHSKVDIFPEASCFPQPRSNMDGHDYTRSSNVKISGLEVTLDHLGPTCSQKRKQAQRCPEWIAQRHTLS